MVSSRFRHGFVVRSTRALYMRFEIKPICSVKSEWERLKMGSLAARHRGRQRAHKVFTSYMRSFDIALERRECKLGLLPSLADCAAPTSRERNATACPFAEGRGRGGRHFKVIAYACLQNKQPRWQLHGARSLLSNTCISRCRAPPLSPLSKVELDIGIA